MAQFALACAWVFLLCSGATGRLDGKDPLTRQHQDHVEQIEAPDHADAPFLSIEPSSEEDLPEEESEPSELTDDDETEHWVLITQRLDAAKLESQAGFYESPSERAPVPFALRAFSNRGSPAA